MSKFLPPCVSGVVLISSMLWGQAAPLPLPSASLARSGPLGILESFLANTSNPATVTRSIRTVTGEGGTRASFVAVVASDPLDPQQKVKGVKVLLGGPNGETVVYLDDDCDKAARFDSLRDFQAELSRAAREYPGLKNSHTNPAFRTVVGIGGADLNRWGGSLDYFPRFVALHVSPYKKGDQLGVVMNPGRSNIWFYFPTLTLNDIVEIVANARAFLDAN